MQKNRAKKSFGQHFLVNEPLSEAISESVIQLAEFPRLLEIGPGKGVLTKYLLKKEIDFIAVDADRDMIQYLGEHYPKDASKFTLNDCLKLDFHSLFEGQEFCVIGNFPYNISSQIVFKIIKNRELVPEMVGMFQKEMADRIVAPHGSKTYGVISVLTQAFYDCEMLFKVAPGSFQPPPKVNSAVIRLTRKKQFIDCDERMFRIVVKTAFSQRRKMLRNTLKSLIQDPEILADEFYSKRPEQLSLEEFVNITKSIKQ